jgi:HlyD family secretion protein
VKRLIKILIVTAILVGIAVALKLTIFQEKPVPVSVHRVDRGRVETLVVNSRAGTLRSRLRAQLSPGVAGNVLELHVVKGETVTAGHLLLRLDDVDYRAQVAIAEKALSAARAAEKEIEVRIAQAERDLLRATALAAEKAVATAELETHRAARDAAVAAAATARERIRQAAASVDAARAALAKTRLVAPFDGVIANLTTERGEWLSPSPPGVLIPPVIDLIAPDSVYVAAPIDEVDLARLRVGLPVRISIDAARETTFPGRLARLAAFVSEARGENRTLEVEVEFDDPRAVLAFPPGATADVEIILEARPNVLRIPTYALLEGNRVLVIENGRLATRRVRTGLANWEHTEILDGLREGEEVVTSLDRMEVKEGVLAIIEPE